MSVALTSFSNDERACYPTLLKTVSPIEIFIDQVHKFQNSFFKEHPWKAAWKVKQYLTKNILFKRSQLKYFSW